MLCRYCNPWQTHPPLPHLPSESPLVSQAPQTGSTVAGVPVAVDWIKSSSPTFKGKDEGIYIPVVYILLLKLYFKKLTKKKSMHQYFPYITSWLKHRFKDFYFQNIFYSLFVSFMYLYTIHPNCLPHASLTYPYMPSPISKSSFYFITH